MNISKIDIFNKLKQGNINIDKSGTANTTNAEVISCISPRISLGDRHSHTVRCLAFSKDGQWLASGSGPNDKTIKLWNLSKVDINIENQTLIGHDDFIWSVAFRDDSKWLLSGSNEGFIIIWQKSDLNEWLKQFTISTNFSIRAVAFVNFSNDNLLFVTGGADHSVRLWGQLNSKITLYSTSCQTILSSFAANIDGAKLSPENMELLKQRGAIDEPKLLLTQFNENSLESKPITFKEISTETIQKVIQSSHKSTLQHKI